MSFPLTIPVSMPHHYNRFFGNGAPSSGGQPPGSQAPAPPFLGPIPSIVTASSLMAPPPPLSGFPTMDTVRTVSSHSGAPGERVVPMRKQSVFEAPTGLSALRRNASRLTDNFAFSPPSPPEGSPSPSVISSGHISHHQSSSHYLSASPPDASWSTSSSPSSSSTSSGHPLDLTGENAPSPLMHNTGHSRQVAPSKEELDQHISRLILENKALMESFEPFMARNHSTGGPSFSRRSMSTTVQPSASLGALPASSSSSSSSGARGSLSHQFLFGGTFPSNLDSANAAAVIRRYSSDVAPAGSNFSSFSRLQSALLGEGKSNDLPPTAPPPTPNRVHPGRKYSEIPYQQQPPHPESFKYPLSQTYLQQHHQQPQQQHRSSLKSHKHSMILGNREHLLDILPALSESSRSSSEPSLVRNLLTSKTSPFAHLVSSEHASLHPTSGTSCSSLANSAGSGGVTSDSSIIKDLLLKSRNSSQVDGQAASSATAMFGPPSKRSRTESASYDPMASQQSPTSGCLFPCALCHVPFRSRQNLEVHQRFYCRGSDSAKQSTSGNLPERFGAKRSHQELGNVYPMPARKVSVLERPSIITFSIDSPVSSPSTISIESNHSEQHTTLTPEETEGGFGNILKSKLLSPETDAYSAMTPLKKRKISEPAFRYNDYKHKDSFTKPHRLSIMQPPVFHRNERSAEHQLEILHAYLPYLQPQSIKITVKSPVLFPVLQDLVDTCTNHEFVVDKELISMANNSLDHSFIPHLDMEVADQQEATDDGKMIIPEEENSQTPESMSGGDFLVKTTSTLPQTSSVDSLEAQVHVTMSHLLDMVCASVDGNSPDGEVVQCLSDLVDSLTFNLTVSQQVKASTTSLVVVSPPKKPSIARPTTLDLGRSYDQSARNERELGLSMEFNRKISRLSIYVNRCSNQDEDISSQKKNQLIASTLISPDTPRAKRKYQQLYINGNAYTNLGLKVTLRPTYCCIYSQRPMFVTQEAYPQLSMYSQWKTVPLPEGDILEQVGSPRDLLAAYNSTEAVFAVSRSRLALVEVATAATMGGIEMDSEGTEQSDDLAASTQQQPVVLPEIVKPTGTVSPDFLEKVSARLTNYMSSNLPVRPDPEEDTAVSPFAARAYERTFHASLISSGEGTTSRLSDTCARSQFILTHSTYHQLSTQARIQAARSERIRKRSRTHAVDIFKSTPSLPGKTSEMVVASGASNSAYLSQSEHASRLPLTETSSSSTLKLPEMALAKPRKRSSTSSVMSATSMSSSTFSPFLTMHPMLGHLPAKSKQTVMYIMMMSQAPMSMSVPTVSSLASSKNMASRKFSECIGVKPNTAIEENWAARLAVDGSAEMVPKRIKIFEGGFKSNEDYTYVRGRGRGKYVCEECGIRCKKPSMLKKHIRTHTDLRPYSCRHCAFAFKTKGNLTKHMKSKAHHKKCVELGIIPVPTSIDDSQIDNDALAKQEQYELTCGSTGGLNQFADDDDDCDDDYDEDDEFEDEEDDEGVPIPLIEQQRLTYIVPGQFDDADGEHSNETPLGPKAPISHKSSDGSSTLSATSFSPRQKLSISSLSGVSLTTTVASSSSSYITSSTASSLSPASSTLPLSITDIRSVSAEDNDKHASSAITHASNIVGNQRKISSSSRSSSSTLSPAGLLSVVSHSTGSKMMLSGGALQSSPSSSSNLTTPPNQQPIRPAPQTCALQSYHFGQGAISAAATAGEPNKNRHLAGNQLLTSSSISLSPPPATGITKENEAEAARSLLILSGVSAHNSSESPGAGGAGANTTTTNTSTSIASSTGKLSNAGIPLSDISRENALYRRKKSSTVQMDFHSGNQSNERVAMDKTVVSGNGEASLKTDRLISYEVASDHVLLASQIQQQQAMAAESRQSPIEMMRRISAASNPKVDRRTSQPTSVIISRASPTESLEDYEDRRRKRSRHERSISESSSISAHSFQMPMPMDPAAYSGLALSPKSSHLLNMSSFMTAPTATYVNTNPAISVAAGGHFVSPNNVTAAAAAAAAQQMLHQQYANLGVRNPRAALIAEEIKRAANGVNAHEAAIQQHQQQQQQQQQLSALLLQQQQLQHQHQQQSRMASVINSLSPPGPIRRDSVPPPSSLSNGTPSLPFDPNMLINEQQKALMAQIYEGIKQQFPRTASSQAQPKPTLPPPNVLNPFGLSNAELTKVQLGLSTPIAIASNGSHQMKIQQQQQQSISPNLGYHMPAVDSKKVNSSPREKEPVRKSPLIFNERNSVLSTHSPGTSRHFGGNSSSSTFSSSVNVPLPPAPSSPLPAPIAFDSAKTRSTPSSDENDQPMDLSKSSSIPVPEVSIHPIPARGSSPSDLSRSALSASSMSSLSPPTIRSLEQRQPSPSSLSPGQPTAASFAAQLQLQQHPSPNRQPFRPMMEEKQLTEQLVAAFSPHHELQHPMAFSTNGRERYKNIRSEEFAHLSTGVHTPHRLPQNMLHMGARATAAAASAASPSSPTSSSVAGGSPGSTSGGPVARTPNSLANAYTTADGKSVCTICMKQFTKPSQLRLHINIHFFERPFRCDSCAVSFRTKGHLQKHSRSVSHLNKLNMNITFGRPSTDNPRPFKCSDCKIAFRIHGHLAKHLRSKMHIMKLECLGKLPFGMYAEMERSNANLNVDTTDCEKALESLRSLAQQLYDPRQMCWKVTETASMDDAIEEDMDDDLGDEEGYPDDDPDLIDGGPLIMALHSPEVGGVRPESGINQSSSVPFRESAIIVPTPRVISPTEQQSPSNGVSPPPPLPHQPSPVAHIIQSAGIATRSNTCPLCNRIFKAAKFLQVHLHCDHPESAASEPAFSSV